jgi:YD repeat-containing protein
MVTGLGHVVRGAVVQLAETTMPSMTVGTRYEVAALLDGGIVTLTLDGAEVAHCDFGSAPTSDEVGLFTISAHIQFDDFAVTPEGDGLVMEDFSGGPHAAKAAGANRFRYDLNGNMVLRVEISGTQVTTYTQQFDLENRLTAVTVTQATGSPQVTRWAYDGDGERFREDAPDGGVTLYVAELQEEYVAGGQVLTRTSYYYHGGVRVGMRVAGVLYYLHADHPFASLRAGWAA